MVESSEKGMKALSFQQPYATEIMLGVKTIECRTRKVKTPIKNLVVCSSKTANAFYPIPGLAYGFAMALVDVVDCVPFTKKHLDAADMEEMPAKESYVWILENPRPIKPFSVHATASFFYVQDDIIPVTIGTANDYQKLYDKIYNSKIDKDNGATPEDVIAGFFED
jgi:hypothetical protein